jgi:peptide/nickel transport system permease protein
MSRLSPAASTARRIGATLKQVASSLSGAVGLVLVAAVLVAALFAPWIATHDPDKLDVLNRFSGPSAGHWLGTDHLGRDLYSRLVHGSRVAMIVAVSSIGIALVVGTYLGIVMALAGKGWERVVLVLFDVISSFPSLVLALAVVAIFGPSTLLVVVVVAVTLIPHFGRVARAQVLTLKSAPFIEAERLLGASTTRIVVSHLLPNISGSLVVLASMDIPGVITIEAGLSFLGLGVRPPFASWGTLINDGYTYLSDSLIPVTIASAALGLATLGFTLFGEALRDAVDPRSKEGH